MFLRVRHLPVERLNAALHELRLALQLLLFELELLDGLRANRTFVVCAVDVRRRVNGYEYSTLLNSSSQTESLGACLAQQAPLLGGVRRALDLAHQLLHGLAVLVVLLLEVAHLRLHVHHLPLEQRVLLDHLGHLRAARTERELVIVSTAHAIKYSIIREVALDKSRATASSAPATMPAPR